jgi:hypothetical protein
VDCGVTASQSGRVPCAYLFLAATAAVLGFRGFTRATAVIRGAEVPGVVFVQLGIQSAPPLVFQVYTRLESTWEAVQT